VAFLVGHTQKKGEKRECRGASSSTFEWEKAVGEKGDGFVSA